MRNLTRIVCVFLILVSFGCSTLPEYRDGSAPPLRTLSEDEIKSSIFYNPDPMEGFNRGAYKFNYYFDDYVFLPIVKGYEFLLPVYAQNRLSDALDNITEFRNFTNNLYQLKIANAGITFARFAINSTIGIAGFWDVATPMGLERKPEDLGQSLGHYGVGSGPYLIVPVSGPSSVRDGGGLIGDYAVSTFVGPYSWYKSATLSWSVTGMYVLDTRHRIPFRYHSTDSPFEYELVRLLYGMKREMDIAK